MKQDFREQSESLFTRLDSGIHLDLFTYVRAFLLLVVCILSRHSAWFIVLGIVLSIVIDYVQVVRKVKTPLRSQLHMILKTQFYQMLFATSMKKRPQAIAEFEFVVNKFEQILVSATREEPYTACEDLIREFAPGEQ